MMEGTNKARGAAACRAQVLVLLALLGVAGLGCKGAGQTASTDGGDAGGDGKGEVGLPACPDPAEASAMAAADDFGPNAKATAMPAALGRVNVYEVTGTYLLERVDVYVRADLAGTRVTLAVFVAPSKDKPFQKLTDVQVDVPSCEGWASSGAVAIPLDPGRFYAVGFDPNQLVTTFVNADLSNLPIDGHFGRLIGSKTVTSVSIATLTWDKVADKDFMRQRLMTSPRMVDDAGSDDASDGGADDAGVGGDAPPESGDAPRDGADAGSG